VEDTYTAPASEEAMLGHRPTVTEEMLELSVKQIEDQDKGEPWTSYILMYIRDRGMRLITPQRSLTVTPTKLWERRGKRLVSRDHT